MPIVLIVDDEPIVRNLVRLALARAGYNVLDAKGASDAAALCHSVAKQDLDLLIVDHGLKPDKGRVLAEDLARLCPAVKVLIISGWSYQIVHDDDGLPPGSSFLQKPFSAQQLLSTVERILFPRTQ